jgi:Arc/MetJ-type ribon-helix-helix transcriptional regulator
MALSRMIKKRERKNKPPAGSIPTYIRFTGGMLKKIDRATEKGGYINASEFVREAVRLFIREMRRGTFSPGEHQELVHGGKPTYIRFMETQLVSEEQMNIAKTDGYIVKPGNSTEGEPPIDSVYATITQGNTGMMKKGSCCT